MTYYAPWLVDNDKLPLSVVMDNFHWFSGDRGFMPVYDIPMSEVQLHRSIMMRRKHQTLFGHRSG